MESVMCALAAEISRALGISAPVSVSGGLPFSSLDQEFLPDIVQKLGRRRLVILVDESDILTEQDPSCVSPQVLLPRFQELLTRHDRLAFVFAIGRRLEDLPDSYKQVFKSAVAEPVSFLGREAATALVREPCKELLDFPPETVEQVLELTACHPYYTQLICYELFRRCACAGIRTVAPNDVHAAIDPALETGRSAFVWFWDGLRPAERFVGAAAGSLAERGEATTDEAIARAVEEYGVRHFRHEISGAIEMLAQWDIIRRTPDGQYRFVVELVRQWIVRRQPLESPRRELERLSPRASRRYKTAEDAYAEGDLEDALLHYRKALEMNPQHASARLGSARTLARLERWDDAVAEFERSRELDSLAATDGIVRARLGYAEALEREGRLTEAILQCRLALRVSADGQDVHEKLAGLYLAQGKEHTADRPLDALAWHQRAKEEALACSLPPTAALSIEITEALTEAQSQSSKLLWEQAQLCEDNEDWEAAAEAYEMLASFPDGEAANEKLRSIRELVALQGDEMAVNEQLLASLKHKGDILHRSGRLHQAAQCFEEGLAAAPDDAEFMIRKADVLRKMGENDLALEELARAVEVGTDGLKVRALALRQMVLVSIGRYGDAISACDQALGLREGDAGLLRSKADSLSKLGEIDRAVGILNEATSGLPPREAAVTLRFQAELLHRVGRYEDALQALDQSLGLDPADSLTSRRKATTLSASGRGEEAAALLAQIGESVATPMAERVSAWLQRAHVLHDTARDEEALRSVEQALTLDPANVGSLLHKAKILETQGEREKALRALAEAARLESPRGSSSIRQQAGVLERGGRLDDARGALERAIRECEGFEKFSALVAKGDMLRRAGLHRDAAGAYGAALEIRKRDIETHRKRADALDAAGEKDEAAKAREEAVTQCRQRTMGPRDLRVMASILEKLQRTDEAVALADEAVRASQS